MPKRTIKQFDLPFRGAPGALPDAGSTATATTPPAAPPPATPAPAGLLAPTGLAVLDTTNTYTGTVSKWFVRVGWSQPAGGVPPTSYEVQWTPLADFASVVPITTATTEARWEVYANTTYRVRVRALSGSQTSDWSATLTFTSAIDSSTPAAPTGVAAVFADSGDLHVTWTPGATTNIRYTRVEAFTDATAAGNGTAALWTTNVAGSSAVWPIAANLAAGGHPAPYVRVSSVSYFGVQSSLVTPSPQPVFALPSAPSVTLRWDLRAGSFVMDWPRVARAVAYVPFVRSIARPQQAAERYVYPLSLNKSDGGGTAATTLAWMVQAVDPFGRLGTSASGSSTAPLPPTPSVTWEFDSPDLLLEWSISEPVVDFAVAVGVGSDKYTAASQYRYTFAMNVAAHGTPDPSLNYRINARDAFGRLGIPATGTAINPVPDAPASVVVIGGVSQLGVTTLATLPTDLKHLAYRIVKDGATLTTVLSRDLALVYTATVSGSYQIGVAVVDVFDQASTETLSSAVVLDVLTIADLRAGMTYRDNLGTTSSTLDRLKDDVRTGSGVVYPGS